jgi:hypothetical protein
MFDNQTKKSLEHFEPQILEVISFLVKIKEEFCVHTSLSFARISFTEDICFVICAISFSDSANDINNCSRSGLR